MHGRILAGSRAVAPAVMLGAGLSGFELTTDSDGNRYTAEAQRGRRVQKFTLTGLVSTR